MRDLTSQELALIQGQEIPSITTNSDGKTSSNGTVTVGSKNTNNNVSSGSNQLANSSINNSASTENTVNVTTDNLQSQMGDLYNQIVPNTQDIDPDNFPSGLTYGNLVEILMNDGVYNYEQAINIVTSDINTISDALKTAGEYYNQVTSNNARDSALNGVVDGYKRGTVYSSKNGGIKVGDISYKEDNSKLPYTNQPNNINKNYLYDALPKSSAVGERTVNVNSKVPYYVDGDTGYEYYDKNMAGGNSYLGGYRPLENGTKTYPAAESKPQYVYSRAYTNPFTFSNKSSNNTDNNKYTTRANDIANDIANKKFLIRVSK